MVPGGVTIDNNFVFSYYLFETIKNMKITRMPENTLDSHAGVIMTPSE